MKKLIKEIKTIPHAAINNQITAIQFVIIAITLFGLGAIIPPIVNTIIGQ
ncbi:hypothetical protein [Mucilaginibacter sp.]|nr:hypothetical protein [Mucilaginibacter sp.]